MRAGFGIVAGRVSGLGGAAGVMWGEGDDGMRIEVTLGLDGETGLPVNYQYLLTSAVYGLLGESDAEFARFLHDEGYEGEGGRRFKLFTFSWLRGRNRVSGERIVFAPGAVTWRVSSPVAEFARHLATGLLARGSLAVGGASLPIRSVEALAEPDLSGGRFTCLSPVVASVPVEGRPAQYLTPAEEGEFSEAVRRGLVRRHRVLYGADPADDRLELAFDRGYVARSGGGTKLMAYKDIRVRGAFAPLTLSGSAALIRLGYEAGLGEKTAWGLGMIEAAS